ncbi:hypothetical protein Tcan_11996 [Toxocara canis]|uniref:Transmembrane protein n=1 Tax=Toxocara canis TaxID=6265 RepID=A0A0B2UW19_TOXCA|nr:hypothetical protein Tcan_11996 [Toxocara canis]
MEKYTSSDAEQQQRRHSAIFIGVAELCDLPHLKHERDVESVAEILDELNVGGVPVEVYRMGVFNPTKHRPVKWLTGCRMITTMVERTLEKELKRIVENLKKDLASGGGCLWAWLNWYLQSEMERELRLKADPNYREFASNVMLKGAATFEVATGWKRMYCASRHLYKGTELKVVWNVGCNGPTVEHLEFGEGTQLTGGHRRIEMGFGMNAAGEVNRKLTPEEVQFLLQKLSSDEQKELGQVLKKCTTEMTLTRGLPFAAAVIGSLYLARQRLPTALHFGPKKWPFYFVVGIGALTTANLLSISTCAERIHPHLNALWQKVTSTGKVPIHDHQRSPMMSSRLTCLGHLSVHPRRRSMAMKDFRDYFFEFFHTLFEICMNGETFRSLFVDLLS